MLYSPIQNSPFPKTSPLFGASSASVVHTEDGGLWNELPKTVVKAGTVTKFKRHLGRYIDRKGSVEYGPNLGWWD